MKLKNIFLFNHLMGTQVVTVFYWLMSLSAIINAITAAIPLVKSMNNWHLLAPQLLTVAGVLVALRLVCEIAVLRIQADMKVIGEKNDRVK